MNPDGIVIGGGAAGMMAAISAAQAGSRVMLLEKNSALGKKLRITGKGRCNVTNRCTVEEALQNIPRGGRFLHSAMAAFPPEKTMAFFEDRGCPLKTERGSRVFPVSDRSDSVVSCLCRELERTGVVCRTAAACRILRSSQGAAAGVETRDGAIPARWVILATGGLSYPATGSTGDGYRMARELGHTIVPPEGSLVPLEAAGEDCAALQGLSLRNVGVKLVDRAGKVLYRDFGELLFTHFGLSGPTILSASCHLAGEGCRILIDLKPALDEQTLDARLLRDLQCYRNRSMEHALTDLLPRSLIPVALRRAGIDPSLQANALKRQQRRALAELLKAFSVDITGKRPVSEAIVTSGGVALGEVNPKTMASKIVPGLYFAGEVLDCDGYTGGFNLQIAWATGFVSGAAAAKTGIDKSAAVY